MFQKLWINSAHTHTNTHTIMHAARWATETVQESQRKLSNNCTPRTVEGLSESKMDRRNKNERSILCAQCAFYTITTVWAVRVCRILNPSYDGGTIEPRIIECSR